MADEPTIKVEIALASAPLAASPTWTDVSAYFVSGSISRGRQRELDRYQAGTMSMVLRNEDRRFDPLYTSGAYWPNVKPMKRIRVTATWNSVDYIVYDGYIDSWKQSYQIPNVATVEIDATDLFKVLAALELPASVYAAEVLTDTPVFWWRLGEPAGNTTVVDSVTGQSAAAFGTPTLGASGLVSHDDDSALSQANATSGFEVLGTFIAAGSLPALSFEAIVKTSGSGGGAGVIHGIFAVDRQTLIYLSSPSTNKALFTVFTTTSGGAGTSWAVASSGNITDGNPHHIVGTYDGATVLKIYVDGVLAGTDAASNQPISTQQLFDIGNLGVSSAGSAHSDGMVGTIDECAVYLSELNATRVAAHASARATPWNGDTPGQRAGRIADLVGIPAALRNFDTGSSILQSTDLR